MVKFIILTTQRTGSTLLWKFLNGHPSIEGHGEMFLSTHRGPDTYAMYKKRSVKRRILHYTSRQKILNEYMNELFQQKEKIRAIGFKLMYTQFFRELENWIFDNQISIIHLIRENVLKTIVSRVTAKKRSLYHAKDGDIIHDVKVKINPKKLIKNFEKIINEVNMYKTKFQDLPYIEISYESFTKDRENCSKKLFEFLKVPHIENLPVPLRKINPESLEKIIINYDKIVSMLSGTIYENYLY